MLYAGDAMYRCTVLATVLQLFVRQTVQVHAEAIHMSRQSLLLFSNISISPISMRRTNNVTGESDTRLRSAKQCQAAWSFSCIRLMRPDFFPYNSGSQAQRVLAAHEAHTGARPI
jgi:hypothetical protein